MSGGSAEPESPIDKKCPSCGRYYMDRGISFKMHEASCSGGDGDGDGNQESVASNMTSNNPLKDGPDAESRETNEEPACPECGASAGVPASELEAGALYVCDGCGERLRWDGGSA